MLLKFSSGRGTCPTVAGIWGTVASSWPGFCLRVLERCRFYALDYNVLEVSRLDDLRADLGEDLVHEVLADVLAQDLVKRRCI